MTLTEQLSAITARAIAAARQELAEDAACQREMDANGDRAIALCRDAAEARRAALHVDDTAPLAEHGWLTLLEDQELGALISIGERRP